MRANRLLTISTATLASAMCFAQGSLQTTNGDIAVQTKNQLFVALKGGGIGGFDKASGRQQVSLPTSGEVADLELLDGKVCWVPQDSKSVFVYDPQTSKTQQFEVPSAILRGAIMRVSGWKGMIVVHGETEFAFIDLSTRMIRRAYDVLPRDVYEIAKQGPVQTVSQDGSDLFVSIRRCGTRVGVSGYEAIPDIAMITAWSTDSRGDMKLVGGYTCSLVRFRDAEGPKVHVEMGMRYVDSKFGTADLWNIKLGPEGMIGLGMDEAFVVPFFQNSWVPNRVKTAFKPRYAQRMDYSQESAWWTDGSKAYRTDLEDGSTDAFLPKGSQAKINAVLSDPEGAWILSADGVRRIELDAQAADYTRVSMSSYSEAQSHEQLMLQKSIQKFGARRGNEPLKNLLVQAGAAANCMTPIRRVEEAELGDLIVDGSSKAIYLGGGKMLTEESGSLTTTDVTPTEDMRFFRVLPRSPLTDEDLNPPTPQPVAPSSRPTPGRPTPPERPYNGGWQPSTPAGDVRDEDLTPIGVNRPKPGLGNTLFVRCVPGAEFDRPQTEKMRRLLDIAKSWLGTPYRWGGNSKSGVDCSGFVVAVYREMGIQLPRHSQDIGRARFGKVVKSELHFGDVLVFQSPKHVALYVGNGQTIEAVSGGVGFSTIYRRTQAIVRRFL